MSSPYSSGGKQKDGSLTEEQEDRVKKILEDAKLETGLPDRKEREEQLVERMKQFLREGDRSDIEELRDMFENADGDERQRDVRKAVRSLKLYEHEQLEDPEFSASLLGRCVEDKFIAHQKEAAKKGQQEGTDVYI